MIYYTLELELKSVTFLLYTPFAVGFKILIYALDRSTIFVFHWRLLYSFPLWFLEDVLRIA
jgi:hypothetical protein